MNKKTFLRMPSYYKKFSCTADKCSDNCCIGWEIDIDKKSYDLYKSVQGEFGKKLDENISYKTVPHFILGKNERCPFLNEQNLCEVYINLGEQSLCEICTNHPRFYEWYDGVKEGGIGLCCEAAAEIIITEKKEFSYYDIEIPFEDCGDYDSNFYNYLFTIRNKILTHLQNSAIPFSQRLNDILYFANECQNMYDNFSFEIPEIKNTEISSDRIDISALFNEFSSLEMLDESRLFEKAFQKFKDPKTCSKIFQNNKTDLKAFENLTIYFVWRHFLKSVFEDEFYSKIAFAVLSTLIIALLFYSQSCQNLVNASVYYSKEVEYSDENLNKIFDNFYENNEFSISKISSLCKIF